MNTIAYIIYLPITAYITVVVGHRLHADGAYYVHDHFPGQRELATLINRFLLIGYYLVNLCYVAVSLRFWNSVNTWLQLTEELASRVGFIVISLGIMHYLNMAVLALFAPKSTQSLTSQ